MRQYIKTFAFMLLVGLGLTSCLDDDRFDKETISYPQDINFGAWATHYTEGNYEYHAVLTKNAAGDSIFYVHRIAKPTSKDSGEVVNLFVCDSVSYNQVAGVASLVAPESAFGDDVPVTSFLSYPHGQNYLTLQVIANKTYSLTVQKTDTMYVEGYWEGGIKDETGNYTAYFLCLLEGVDAEGVGHGLAIFDSDMNDAETITYTVKDNVLSVTSEEKATHTLTGVFNDSYQLEVTDHNDVTFVIDPQRSDVLKKEFTFDHALVGDYTYEQFFSGSDPGLVLRPISLDDPTNQVWSIEHWGYDVTFIFRWNTVDNQIEVPEQFIGYTHATYGDVYVCDAPTFNPNAYSFGTNPSYFDEDNNTFVFNVAYYVSAGYFGVGPETFEVTDDAPEDSAVRARLQRRHAPAAPKVQFNKTFVPFQR